MFIVLGLYSRISLCTPQASPPPHHSETREVAQLSDAVVDGPTVDSDGENKNSIVTLNSRNDMISIYQRSARTNECKITLILSDCFMNGVIMFSIIFIVATCSSGAIYMSQHPWPIIRGWLTKDYCNNIDEFCISKGGMIICQDLYMFLNAIPCHSNGNLVLIKDDWNLPLCSVLLSRLAEADPRMDAWVICCHRKNIV